jgi:hypothetical protein
MALSEKKIEEFNRITHDFFDFLFEMSEIPAVIQKHTKNLNVLISGVKEISKYFNNLKSTDGHDKFNPALNEVILTSNVIHQQTFPTSTIAADDFLREETIFQRKLEEHVITMNTLKIENEKLRQKLEALESKVLNQERATTQLSKVLILTNSEIKNSISRHPIDKTIKEHLERLFKIFEKLIQANIFSQNAPQPTEMFSSILSHIFDQKPSNKEFTLNPNAKEPKLDIDGDKIELLYLLTIQANMIEKKLQIG